MLSESEALIEELNALYAAAEAEQPFYEAAVAQWRSHIVAMEE